MKRALLLSTALLWPLAAHAADIAVKAPAASQPAVYCTLQSCSGIYGGLDILETGGSFNVVSTGLQGLAQNDFAMGGHLGYQFWNGSWFLAGEAGADYGIVQNGQLPGGGNTGLWDAYGLAKVGYSLASVFGLSTTGQATPTLPTQLANSLLAPYLIIGDWTRPWGSGFASGAGVEALIATNWTISVDYIHVDYNNANINPNVNEQTENIVKGGIDYHF